jgi:hypothetical protein
MRGISVILTTVVAIVFILGACAKPVAAPAPEPPSTPEPIPAPTPSPTPVPETPAQEPASAPAPPVEKEIEVHYRTFWVYFPPEDSFTNREVTGVTESWAVDVHNVAERLVANATLSLDTDIVFDQLIPHPATIGPPTYRWSFGDITEGAGSSAVVGLRPSPDMSLPVTFSPGFDASRFADKNMFSEPGIQTIALEVVPRESEIQRLRVGVQAEGNELVDAVIISPATNESEGIILSQDGQSLTINLASLGLNELWTTTITIQVTPMVPTVEYMPYVDIAWEETLAFGEIQGNSVSYRAGDPAEEIGTWELRARDRYGWHWNEHVNRVVKWFAIREG